MTSEARRGTSIVDHAVDVRSDCLYREKHKESQISSLISAKNIKVVKGSSERTIDHEIDASESLRCD